MASRLSQIYAIAVILIILTACQEYYQPKTEKLCNCKITSFAHLTEDRVVVTRDSDEKSNIYCKSTNSFALSKWYDIYYNEYNDIQDELIFNDVIENKYSYTDDITINRDQFANLNQSLIDRIIQEKNDEIENIAKEKERKAKDFTDPENVSNYLTTRTFKLGTGTVTFDYGSIIIEGGTGTLYGSYEVLNTVYGIEIKITNLQTSRGHSDPYQLGRLDGSLKITQGGNLYGRLANSFGEYRNVTILVLED